MITKAPRNNMATPFRVRDDVGPHQHDWAEVGRDGQGEIYRQCKICDARSCVNLPRYEAYRQDWLNYLEPWAAGEPAAKHSEIIQASEEVDLLEEREVKRGPGRPRKSP